MKKVFRFFGHMHDRGSFDFDLDGIGDGFECVWIEPDRPQGRMLEVLWDKNKIYVYGNGMVSCVVNASDGTVQSGSTVDPDFLPSLLAVMAGKRKSSGLFPESAHKVAGVWVGDVDWST